MEKTCSKCKESKLLSDFYKLGRGGHMHICKACNAAAVAARHLAHPESSRKRANAHRQRNLDTVRAKQAAAAAVKYTTLRAVATGVMGARCTYCLSTEMLEFDHVAGDGGQHRKRETDRAYIYRIAKTGVAEPGIQLLCQPCHRKKSGRETRERSAQKRVATLDSIESTLKP